MKTDREHWKKMLPKIQAFVDGSTIKNASGTVHYCYPDFTGDQDDYIIVEPKERVPLEAEDWIKDGPWWVRVNETDDRPFMVIGMTPGGIVFINDAPAAVRLKYQETDHLQRRNATSDWMPCWKEKE